MKHFFLDVLPNLIVWTLILAMVCFITFLATSEYIVEEYSSEEFAINYRHEQMMLDDWKYCPYCGELLDEE